MTTITSRYLEFLAFILIQINPEPSYCILMVV